MTKKEVLPEGSVSIETVRHLDGFDPFADIPEVATWRDAAVAEAEKPARKAVAPAAKPEKSEG